MNSTHRASLVPPETLQGLAASPAAQLLRHTLTDRPPAESRQVFVNRTLRMERIRYIGFDMDWTLADYDQEELTALAFRLTLERLVERYGFPKEIFRAECRPQFARRGLMIDIEEGMVLKMNRHRYVGRAYHGREFLPPDERARHYRREPIQPASNRFHFVDTLFDLPEVHLFSELVELKKHGVSLPDYRQIFEDTRAASDSIHADDTLKHEMLQDLPRYLPRDPELLLALHRLALDDRKLLLITNSEWYFTDAVCRHLFEGMEPGLSSWRQIFDLVVVESRKPAFFRKANPFVPVIPGAQGSPPEYGPGQSVPQWGEVYRGGSRSGLMELLDCLGEQVLYIGDHIYGDILSSKRVSTWRTALVVRELEEELVARRELTSQHRHTEVLRSELAEFGRRMDDVRDLLMLYQTLARRGELLEDGEALRRTEAQLAEMRREHRFMRLHKNRLQGTISDAINPYWGSVFKQGSNKSLFGSQVDDFACIYTSRVSNLAAYGSHHYFRVLRDQMRHDDVI